MYHIRLHPLNKCVKRPLIRSFHGKHAAETPWLCWGSRGYKHWNPVFEIVPPLLLLPLCWYYLLLFEVGVTAVWDSFQWASLVGEAKFVIAVNGTLRTSIETWGLARLGEGNFKRNSSKFDVWTVLPDFYTKNTKFRKTNDSCKLVYFKFYGMIPDVYTI